MKKFKENKAITLVALVITIIILLILAGISIAQLTGNGLFEKAKLAKEESKNAQDDEDDKVKQYGNEINSYINSDRSGTSKVDILYDGTTDSQGLITEISGTGSERTLYKNVSDYDFVYVYGGYKYGTNEYYYMTPAIVHKSFYDSDIANGGLAQFSSNFSDCFFHTKIDSVNNKIIFKSRGNNVCVIVKVIGVKY